MKDKNVICVLFLLIFGFVFGKLTIEMKAEDEIPITPNDEMYIPIETVEPEPFDIDPRTYRLIIQGEVNNPLNLTLEDIKTMPVTSEIVRITCIAYKFGVTDYTGVANWTGVSLSYILNLARVNINTAVDVSFHTPDLNPWAYSTSLKIEEVFWGDIILAYEMNEVPIPAEHGFPIRLVCPRFFGYKWIRWLMYINVTTEDYIGFYPNNGYDDSPYIDVPLQIYYSPIDP
ncbi:MAG: molybdopterin-dependent oxidoreductase, partial [Candidatus Hodarchaeales archaeon]